MDTARKTVSNRRPMHLPKEKVHSPISLRLPNAPTPNYKPSSCGQQIEKLRIETQWHCPTTIGACGRYVSPPIFPTDATAFGYHIPNPSEGCNGCSTPLVEKARTPDTAYPWTNSAKMPQFPIAARVFQTPTHAPNPARPQWKKGTIASYPLSKDLSFPSMYERNQSNLAHRIGSATPVRQRTSGCRHPAIPLKARKHKAPRPKPRRRFASFHKIAHDATNGRLSNILVRWKVCPQRLLSLHRPPNAYY